MLSNMILTTMSVAFTAASVTFFAQAAGKKDF